MSKDIPPAPVDVLLAVYNGARYLPALLESLAAQSFSDFRLVVSDNRSDDATHDIIDAHRGHFAHDIMLLPPPPETVPASRNFARVTEAASALYVMYADADDVWHRGKIEKTFAAMRAAEARRGTDTPLLVHADLAVVDRALRSIHPSYWAYQNINPRRTALAQILMRNCVTGCTVMMNRALLDLARPIPAEAVMHDYWCALNAAAFGEIVAISEPLIDYRQHGANDTGATAWGAGFLLKRLAAMSGAKGPRARIRGKATQAGALLAHHGERLAPRDRETVAALASLPRAGAWERRRRILRHGLWDDGPARNIGLFLAL